MQHQAHSNAALMHVCMLACLMCKICSRTQSNWAIVRNPPPPLAPPQHPLSPVPFMNLCLYAQVYTDVKQLRYGHLMIMTDQDHDGSHIKGLIMNYFHTFYPSLMRLPGFLIEFITPVIKVSAVPASSQLLLCCADYIYGNIYGKLQLDFKSILACCSRILASIM